jgi:hypothetical protein
VTDRCPVFDGIVAVIRVAARFVAAPLIPARARSSQPGTRTSGGPLPVTA